MAQRSMPFVSETSADGRDQVWARFLTALLRALSDARRHEKPAAEDGRRRQGMASWQ